MKREIENIPQKVRLSYSQPLLKIRKRRKVNRIKIRRGSERILPATLKIPNLTPIITKIPKRKKNTPRAKNLPFFSFFKVLLYRKRLAIIIDNSPDNRETTISKLLGQIKS